MASNIGMAIKRARERQGISQNQLAKRSGISQSAISSIESTTKSPSLDTISDIAQALNTTVFALLKEISPDNIDEPCEVPDKLGKTEFPSSTLSDHEEKLLCVFRQLNAEGQSKIIDYIDDLFQSGKYIKSHPPVVGKEA